MNTSIFFIRYSSITYQCAEKRYHGLTVRLLPILFCLSLLSFNFYVFRIDLWHIQCPFLQCRAIADLALAGFLIFTLYCMIYLGTLLMKWELFFFQEIRKLTSMCTLCVTKYHKFHVNRRRNSRSFSFIVLRFVISPNSLYSNLIYFFWINVSPKM